MENFTINQQDNDLFYEKIRKEVMQITQNTINLVLNQHPEEIDLKPKSNPIVNIFDYTPDWMLTR